jgi:hypothetical protein
MIMKDINMVLVLERIKDGKVMRCRVMVLFERSLTAKQSIMPVTFEANFPKAGARVKMTRSALLSRRRYTLFTPKDALLVDFVATQVEKDLIDSISIGILSALIEEFLGKPFLPESPESPLSPLSPELGDCIILNRFEGE